MRSVTILAGTAAIGALALSAGGCRKVTVEQTSIEKETDGQVHIDGGDISLAASGKTVGLGGKLPDDLPKEVPVYPGAKINMGTRSSTGKPGWALALVTGDDPEHVMAFYRSNLKGFTAVSDRNMGGTYMSVWQSPSLDVTLLVAQAPEQETSISMTVSGK